MRLSLRRTYSLANLFLIIVLWAVTGCTGFSEPDKYYMASTSPSGEVRIIIDYTPPWSFSPHSMHVYGQKVDPSGGGGARHKLLDFELYNDGANLRRDNCSVTWSQKSGNEIATLRCNGQEQDPATYVIDVTGAL